MLWIKYIAPSLLISSIVEDRGDVFVGSILHLGSSAPGWSAVRLTLYVRLSGGSESCARCFRAETGSVTWSVGEPEWRRDLVAVALTK